MQVSVLGIDLGKNVCSIVGLDAAGAVVLRRRVKRETLIGLAAKLPRCIVGMEACCGAHHIGRLFANQGHDVRLMSPEYVRPYVKAQKNDDRDAEGIAEAATRPTMRFVELKAQDQLDMQTLHRSRDRLVGERTALINQLRAILLERGIVVPQGKRNLERHLAVLLDGEEAPGMSPRMRLLIADGRAQWQELDYRIAVFDAEFAAFTKENEDAKRLATIPGVGVMIASAMIAAIGKAEAFEHGRDLSAWLGLVPRQSTTGGKPKLLGISKRGNKYLRKLLIHGARAALPHIAERDTALGRWVRDCSPACVRMSPLWRWPTNWRGSPGRCCGLLLPGGEAPASLRKIPEAVAIARHFLQADKPVAAICHGPQLLIATGLMVGRTATCYRAVKRELEAAGANYLDCEVVVDGNLVTSRQPADIPAFMRAIFRITRLSR